MSSNTKLDKATWAKLMKKFPCKVMETGNIRTCPARLSYPSLHVPSKGDGDFASKYSATLLFPLGADLKIIETAVKETAAEKFGKNVKGLRISLRDQGEKDKVGYVDGALFLAARSDIKPGVLNLDGTPASKQDLYPGCIVIATIRPFAFDNNGKGVSFGLQNVIKIADDEPFGGVPADVNEEMADVLESSGDLEEMLGQEEAAF